jgi:hypothetical protein
VKVWQVLASERYSYIMSTKVCKRCKAPKPHEAYYLTRSGTPQTYCKECTFALADESYQRKLEMVRAALSEPCVDCGKQARWLEVRNGSETARLTGLTRYSLSKLRVAIGNAAPVCLICGRHGANVTKVAAGTDAAESAVRVCPKCQKARPLDEFLSSKSARGRVRRHCRSCNSQSRNDAYKRKTQELYALLERIGCTRESFNRQRRNAVDQPSCGICEKRWPDAFVVVAARRALCLDCWRTRKGRSA